MLYMIQMYTDLILPVVCINNILKLRPIRCLLSLLLRSVTYIHISTVALYRH